MTTSYVPAFSWPPSVERFLVEIIREAPLLNVCSGRTCFGDVRVDRYHPDAQVKADWTLLPFAHDSFGAVFADPPWNFAYREACALFIREALRIAPVAYLMAPWVYGAAWAPLTHCWVRRMPGVQSPLLVTRYERAGKEFYEKQMVFPMGDDK